jgi:hypothetical protein
MVSMIVPTQPILLFPLGHACGHRTNSMMTTMIANGRVFQHQHHHRHRRLVIYDAQGRMTSTILAVVTHLDNDNGNGDENDVVAHDRPPSSSRSAPLSSFGRILQQIVNLMTVVNSHTHPRDISDAFQRADIALTEDWDLVKDAMHDAAMLIASGIGRRNVPSGSEPGSSLVAAKNRFLVQMFVTIKEELDDISTIEGCTSLGPPSSIPNFVNIQESIQSTIQDITNAINTDESNDDDTDVIISVETTTLLLQEASDQLDLLIESL